MGLCWMQPKPDMVINKQMKSAGLYKPRVHGHIPGTAPGDVFYGKGELAITGIHRSISFGIDSMYGGSPLSSVLQRILLIWSAE